MNLGNFMSIPRGKLSSKLTDRLTAVVSADAMWDRSSQSYY
jgi:hypothetical protein